MPYANPIIPGFHPDPSICRVGEDYFLVTSSFEYFPGVPLFHSRDLVNWEQIGHCLTRDSQLPLSGANPSAGIFAPTIRHHDGRLYMVTTNIGNGGNFFVHTDDPRGEWSEPIWLDQGGIDPSLLFDDDGKVYLTTSGNEQSEIDIHTGKRRSEIRTTWEGTGGGHMEAPHLYHIGEYYYLMVAEGGTGPRHMVTIARAENPWGPFEPCPHNPILSHRRRMNDTIQAAGHGDLIQAHNGSWWMVFLAIRRYPGRFPDFHNLGRETFLAPVMWNEDGWPVVNGDGAVSLEMSAETLPLSPTKPQPVRDDFDSQTLHSAWNFLRNPCRENYSLTDRPGWLSLQTSPVTLDDVASPAFIGRRQQHLCCHVETLIDFEPTGDQEAGLTVLMNNTHHYEIGLRREQGKRIVFLRRRIGDLAAVVFSAEAPAGLLRLGVDADKKHYHFKYAAANGDWLPAGQGETRYLSTEVAGGFTGAFFGLYATSNGNSDQAVAAFDYVDYLPLPGDST